MRVRWLIGLGVAAGVVIGGAFSASAVSGAAFTTFNAHVDGASKDVCKNSVINCNIYGAKEYVWLNGGPAANHLGPDGQYFFAVLEPGGQPNPNDRGGVADKNLSDDYDAYTNRTFTVTNGEVSAYTGTHWLDDGKSGPKPNGKVPFIRLFPYSDTTNPGGVYILAICSLEDGYPVGPSDCKYDAFKVKKRFDISFLLQGQKFEDVYADGVKDVGDPGLAGWTISITGTGPDGLPISATATTDANGYWQYQSPTYTFTGSQKPVDVNLTICEVVKGGYTQSFPGGDGCYHVTFTPVGLDSFFELDFGNWRPVDVTACKTRPAYGGGTVAVPGWLVSLTKEGVVVDTQPTGTNGCYTWTGLKPGVAYDVHEQSRSGWRPLGPTDHVFARAVSGGSYAHTFVNEPLQGCTPGFWQGGSDGGQAGGQWLWNTANDPQWTASGGAGTNPYVWTTSFNAFFAPFGGLDGFDMMSLVGTGGGANDYQKAARSTVAAYLNAAWGMGYPYSTAEIAQMWAQAVASGQFLALHVELDAANNAYYRTDGGERCPISANV